MSSYDALPENTEYIDRGCGLFPSCTACPLPACALEAARPNLRADRAAVKVLGLLEEGLTVRQIIDRTGLSRRTVYRAKARILEQLPVITIEVPPCEPATIVPFPSTVTRRLAA